MDARQLETIRTEKDRLKSLIAKQRKLIEEYDKGRVHAQATNGEQKEESDWYEEHSSRLEELKCALEQARLMGDEFLVELIDLPLKKENAKGERGAKPNSTKTHTATSAPSQQILLCIDSQVGCAALSVHICEY